jgi:3-oxoadipate enol-lactonase
MGARCRFFSTKPRVAVNICGSGEAIIFLHGVGTTKSSWDSQLVFFQKTHVAAAWDARGYGDSDDYEGDLDFAGDFVRDLSAVLDGLGIKSAHIVGLSMGGLIAQCFYFAHPDRVSTLVLAHTFPSFGSLGEKFITHFVSARLQPLLEEGTPADTAAETVKGLLGRNASQEARRHFYKSLCELRKQPYVKTLRGLLAQEPPGALEDIQVPTLVLTGEGDPLSPPALALAMSTRIAGSQKAIISDCGHLSNIEQPTDFNSTVHAFISRHAGIATRVTASS